MTSRIRALDNFDIISPIADMSNTGRLLYPCRLKCAAAVPELVAFVQPGLADTSAYINADKTVNGDPAKGKTLFDSTCAVCHGEDGKTFNFGSEAEPEFIGTIAADNPWEFRHKASFGLESRLVAARHR